MLVGVGVVGVLCYPVAILSLVFYITLRQPALIASGQGLMLVNRFRWLFNRFKKERYFYRLAQGTRLAHAGPPIPVVV